MNNGYKLEKYINYGKSWKISFDKNKSFISSSMKEQYDFLYINEFKFYDRTKVGFILEKDTPKLLTRTFSNKETVYSLDFLNNEKNLLDIFPLYVKLPNDRFFELNSSPFSFVFSGNKLLLIDKLNYFIIDELNIDFILNIELINAVIVFDYNNYSNLMISGLDNEDLVFIYRILNSQNF